MQSKQIRNFFSNTLTFAIGGIGTKLISFFLIPLYTHFLNTSEYGTVDVIQNLVTAMTPVISLSIFDAIFRFALDDQLDRNKLFSNGVVVTTLGSGLIIFISLILSLVFKVPYSFLFGMMLTFSAFSSLFLNFIRGIGKVKIFSLAGIISAFTGALLNILALGYFNLGVRGFFASSVLNSIIVLVVLGMWCRLDRYISLKNVSLLEIKELLLYSVPLIPNAFAWWFTLAASRYFILFFVGIEATGIFAVANKVPSMLSVIFSFFSSAWQITAVQSRNEKTSEELYSTMFNYSMRLMFIVVFVMTVCSEKLVGMLMPSEYIGAWKIIPILMVATLFSNLSALLGTTYLAFKDTNMIMITTLIGMALNAVLNLIFVPTLGVEGAGIGSLIGFFVVMLIRVRTTQKYKAVKLDYITMLVNLTFFVGFMYALMNYEVNIVWSVLLIVLLGLYNAYPIIMDFTSWLSVKYISKIGIDEEA